MNVTLPDNSKDKKLIMIYIGIAAICVIAVIVAIYQFNSDESLSVLIGPKQTEIDEEEELKTEFDTIFTNELVGNKSKKSYNKINKNEELVYTSYEKQEDSLNNYEINVSIPCINIDDDSVKIYNNKIEKIFKTKAENILKTENENTLYTLNYIAYMKDDILSMAIYSNLKEGNNVQRVIVQTYNYDLENNKEMTLEDLIVKRNMSKEEVQTKIRTEIENAQEELKELEELGYGTYTRNTKNRIYRIKNTTEFFVYNNHLYIVYAYGNQNATSEMDIIIF